MRNILIASLMIAAGGAHAATVDAGRTQIVHIELRDSSTDPGSARMTIKAEPTALKAGRVTFEAVNESKDLVHEVLVVPAPADGKQLPYDPKSQMIVEKRAHSRGEISDLKPGARGRLTLSLKPGSYILLCNQKGHYEAGMFTNITVEK